MIPSILGFTYLGWFAFKMFKFSKLNLDLKSTHENLLWLIVCMHKEEENASFILYCVVRHSLTVYAKFFDKSILIYA